MRDDGIIEKLKETVDIFDLLDAADIKYNNRLIKHNISCPFHGVDTKPSFTIYPDTNSCFCYTCNGGTAWDQISFWAQVNEWWTDDGHLDMGRSIADLARRYNIRSIRPEWRKGLEANIAGAKAKRQGYAGVELSERTALKTTFTYRIARHVMKIPDEERDARWDEIRDMWDKLERIDLRRDSWMHDLKEWNREAHWVFGLLMGIR